MTIRLTPANFRPIHKPVAKGMACPRLFGSGDLVLHVIGKLIEEEAGDDERDDGDQEGEADDQAGTGQHVDRCR